MGRRTDVCQQCYGPKEDQRHTRCAECMRKLRVRQRAMYEERKLAGLCTACGEQLEADAESFACRTCRERKNDSSNKSQTRRLADPAKRKAHNAGVAANRQRRRELGLCQFCDTPADGARCARHKEIEATAHRERKERKGKRAPTQRGRELEVLLDYLVDAAPTHLEPPIPMRELLARVLETYGSVSATEVGAERRMHRALVTLVTEGRLERVAAPQSVPGYRRPPPRQVRQRVSTLSSTTTAGGQPGAATGNRLLLAASQDAAVVNQDSHPG